MDDFIFSEDVLVTYDVARGSRNAKIDASSAMQYQTACYKSEKIVGNKSIGYAEQGQLQEAHCWQRLSKQSSTDTTATSV